MTMKPLTNWTRRNYRDAKSLFINGEGSEKERAGIAKKMGLYEADVNRGWNPAEGDETGVPVSNVDSWDPYHGQALSSPAPISVKPAPAETMSGDDIVAYAIADRASYGNGIPNASQRMSLRAKPVYAHKDNKGAPYMYSEPTVAQLKEYLKRSIAAVDDPRYQMHWRSAMASLEDEGEGGKTFKELSDRAWMEARRVTAKHRGAIIRMKYAGDDPDTSWIDNASAHAVSAMEPTLYSLEAGATLGVGRELLGALEENIVPEKGTQSALRELEETGIILPPRERMRATMEDSLLGQIVGGAASLLAPWGGAIGAIGKAADIGVRKAGGGALNLLGKATTRLERANVSVPSLLRGTHLGPSVTGAPTSVLGKTAAAGLATGAEVFGLGAVRKGVDKMAGGGGSDAELLPTTLQGMLLGSGLGFGLGFLGKGARASQKSLRTGSGEVTKDLGVLEEQVGGPATRFWSGYETSPAMGRLDKAALKAKNLPGTKLGEGGKPVLDKGEYLAPWGRADKDAPMVQQGEYQTHKFTPGGVASRRMVRPTLQRGVRGEERVLKLEGDENQAFWDKHVGNPSYMGRAAESMAKLFRKRKDIPFEDAAAAREAFRGVTKPTFARNAIDESDILAAEGGGIQLSWEEARQLYGDDVLNKEAAKKLGGLTKEELVEVTVIAKPKLLTPEQYDRSIRALDRKINWLSRKGGEDPLYREVRKAISDDRVAYGKGWDTMKKRHHELLGELEARAQSVGLPPVVGSFKAAGQKDIRNVQDALKGSMGPDASDEGLMRLLGDPLAHSRGARVKPADRAKFLKENPSGLKPPSKAPLLKQWNTARAIEARERLRPIHDNVPGSRPGVIRMLYKGGRPRIDAAARGIERASPGTLGAMGGLYQNFMADERTE